MSALEVRGRSRVHGDFMFRSGHAANESYRAYISSQGYREIPGIEGKGTSQGITVVVAFTERVEALVSQLNLESADGSHVSRSRIFSELLSIQLEGPREFTIEGWTKVCQHWHAMDIPTHPLKARAKRITIVLRPALVIALGNLARTNGQSFSNTARRLLENNPLFVSPEF